MNKYVTGAIIKELREKGKLTQAELAQKLDVSDKTVSKWETGKGYPDITLLEPIAKVFDISVTVNCHGIMLLPQEAEPADTGHDMVVERIEDEYYVRIEHEMNRKHHISFIAAVSSDRIQIVKLYPEGNAETRFKIGGVKKILYYCNRDGLFEKKI